MANGPNSPYVNIYGEDANGDSIPIKITSSGLIYVTDSIVGVARNRIISVVADTLPTLAGTGVASWASPGVKGIVVEGVVVTAGTIALTGAINTRIRYAIDAANDAAAALLLPDATPAASATSDIGQVGGFNLKQEFVPDTEAAGDLRVARFTMEPYYIDVSEPITRLDFAHDIAGVTLTFSIRAVEGI